MIPELCILYRCVAEDEQLTLAAINMKLPFVKFSKVEPTKDGQKIQQSIGILSRYINKSKERIIINFQDL